MTGGTETEVKLRVEDAPAARAALQRLGARLVRARELEDNLLLDHPDGRLRAAGHALRIRRAGGRGLLTFKGARRTVEGVKSRAETETPVEDPDALQAILEELGLRPIFRYQKYRETWEWGEVELVVDETPIGTFLEIEGELPAIHAAASALGFGPESYISESYPALFAASGGKGDMVFR